MYNKVFKKAINITYYSNRLDLIFLNNNYLQYNSIAMSLTSYQIGYLEERKWQSEAHNANSQI